MKSLGNLTKNIRILCVIETLGFGGGAEQLVFSLAPALRELNVDVEFIDLFSWHDDMGVDLENMGFRVHRLNISHRWSLFEGLLKLHNIVTRNQFDVLWGHLYFGNLYVQLAKLLFSNIPSIITLHSYGYNNDPPKSVPAKIKTYVEGWLGSKANLRVGVSHAVAKDYAAYFGWNDVQVVYNGVPTLNIPTQLATADRTLLRTSHGVDEADFLIVVPARLVRQKGHIYLLRALEILKAKDIRLPKVIFIGVKGGDSFSIQLFIDDHQFESVVSIKEPLPHPDLLRLMLASDVVILPSLREPFGIAAAEAMTTGKPVILTKVDGFIELVGDSEGALMVQSESAEELADAIQRLMMNFKFAEELGAKGRQRIIDNFDIHHCASAWCYQFLSVINH
ncbi:glycosyltransferase family 4 protein [Crenothrix sp.]|uniref:glycosyltransferase family 4 protein n=1 Tax=Crenothrix sp. TaxID=3100433 RepID=UPI00374CF87F